MRPERARALGLDDDAWLPRVVDHYRVAATRPQVDGLLVAPGTPAEVEALCAALADGPLDEDEEDHLISLAALAAGEV